MERTKIQRQREILSELDERVMQATNLLKASQSEHPWSVNAAMTSRAKFLNSEIERLSTATELERLDEIIATFEKEEI